MSLGRFSWAILLLFWICCSGKSAAPPQTPAQQPAQTDSSQAEQTEADDDTSQVVAAADTTQAVTETKINPYLLSPTRISTYDNLVKKYSRRFGFDWRLIAAQIFAESRFREQVTSHAGAAGLMQIMPGTAKHLGLDPQALLKPEQNIALGCLYDRQLYNKWKEIDEAQRLAFTFASYNAGHTRVLRAQKKSLDPSLWEETKPHLPRETRGYVLKIFATYEQYKAKYF